MNIVEVVDWVNDTGDCDGEDTFTKLVYFFHNNIATKPRRPEGIITPDKGDGIISFAKFLNDDIEYDCSEISMKDFVNYFYGRYPSEGSVGEDGLDEEIFLFSEIIDACNLLNIKIEPIYKSPSQHNWKSYHFDELNFQGIEGPKLKTIGDLINKKVPKILAGLGC